MQFTCASICACCADVVDHESRQSILDRVQFNKAYPSVILGTGYLSAIPILLQMLRLDKNPTANPSCPVETSFLSLKSID